MDYRRDAIESWMRTNQENKRAMDGIFRSRDEAVEEAAITNPNLKSEMNSCSGMIRALLLELKTYF